MPNLLRQAQQAMQVGDEQAAVDLLESIPGKSPHVLLHLARAKAILGDEQAAEELFAQAHEAGGSPEVADLFHGGALMRAGHLEEAEHLLRSALEADKHNTLASNLLALCLFRLGRHVEAFAYWDKYGWSISRDYLIEITIAFEQFLMQSPAAPEVGLDAVVSESEGATHGRRLSFLRRHFRLRPLLDKAEKLLMSQRTLEAYRLTARALTLAPEDQEALLLKAVALYEMEHYEEAGRLLLRLSRDEAFPLPRYFLAYSLLRLGQLEAAEAMMAKLAPNGPFDYYLHYHLGLARLMRGDLRGARVAFGSAYGDYFIDSREYCFEHLIYKVRTAIERLNKE